MIILQQFLHDPSRSEDAIISVVGLNMDPQKKSLPLKLEFSLDGIGCTQGDLVSDVSVASRMVDKNASFTERIGLRAPSGRVCPARNGRDEMVS